MQFDSLQAFMLMEGHGVFVWSVYVITFVVLAYLVLIPLRKNREFFTQELMRQRRENVMNEPQID